MNEIAHPSPPRALTIAGSDSSAGAGVQADLKTFAAHGIYGLNAVTAVVAEVPGSVASIEAVDPTGLGHQLNRVRSVFSPSTAKTGMLANEANVEVVAHFFEKNPDIALIIDPIIRASAGAELLTAAGLERLKASLLPRATLITPNLPEAEILLGREISTSESFAAAPKRLFEIYGCNVLLKGGHFSTEDTITDVAWIDGAIHEIVHEKLSLPDIHGTGCALSAAIAARLAQGKELIKAIEGATHYLTAALEQHHCWSIHDQEIRALNHFPFGVDFD